MQENSAYYRDLLEIAVDMVQSMTAEGRIVYVNAAWRHTLGYSQEKIDRCSLFDLIHPEHRDEYMRMFQRATKGEKIPRVETVFLTADGRSLTVEGSCACSLKDDTPDAVVSVFRDVTERKRAEEVLARQATQLLRAHEALEEKDRLFSETLEQARKYREAQARAQELARINEELTQEMGRRRQAEERIRASLSEKEVLLKEIHHRVKNNLQIISSLLNLQLGDIDEPRILEMFRESQDRVQTMALIHEKLYRSEDLARVDFAEYIHGLANYLIRSYRAQAGIVNLKIDVVDVFLSLDVAIPCGLIVNELVSNALKYAFEKRGKGEIRIALHSGAGDRLTLIVGDNGIGLPQNLDFRKTDSLGLQLVTTLVDQLDGTIRLNHGEGTEFQIIFKAKQGMAP